MTQDEINLMVEQAGFHGVLSIGVVMDSKQLETLIKLAAAKEREACARLSEEWQGPAKDKEIHIAAAIRARGQA